VHCFSRIYTCPVYTTTVVYLEWLVALILMLNTAYHFVHYLRRTFYLDPVILSPTQKKLLGISDSGTDLLVYFLLKNESRHMRSSCCVCACVGRPSHVHVYVLSALLKHFTDFYKTWYQCYAIRGHPNDILFSFL
jgi:hypothetical protein